MFTLTLVCPADAPRFFTSCLSADTGHNIWSTRIWPTSNCHWERDRKWQQLKRLMQLSRI